MFLTLAAPRVLLMRLAERAFPRKRALTVILDVRCILLIHNNTRVRSAEVAGYISR
jgi:hypothetical protein